MPNDARARASYRTQALPGPIHPALAHCTGFALAMCARAGDALFARELEPLGLAPPHVGALLLLEAAGAMTQSRLGEALRIDKATMVRLVDALEALGLARRRPNPDDARAVLVGLEPAGARVVREARQAEARAAKALLHGLTADERRHLHRLLEKLAAHLPGDEAAP